MVEHQSIMAQVERQHQIAVDSMEVICVYSVCVRACVRACVCACVRACVHACVRE